MATKISLREFQESLVARLQSFAAREGATSSRLGIQVGSQFWLASLADISETLPVPAMTSVPLVQPWFCGITNIRGSLYGIVDFCRFLGAAPASPGMDARLLLVHPKFRVNAGLIVGRIMGLRNIEQMQPVESSGEPPPWVAAQYRDDGGDVWQELNMQALTAHEQFLNIAL